MKAPLPYCSFWGVWIAVSLGAATPASAVDGTSEVAVSGTRITAPLADGAPVPPAPKRVLPPFQAMSTVERRIDVVEPPPMAGLPPVTGTITQRVHLIDDPGLADPLPPLPVLPVTDPAVLARLKEMRQQRMAWRVAFVSATVYDHTRTFLRCYPNGQVENEIQCWSNLDFSHFCGFSTFQVTGRDGVVRKYSLLMGIGDINTRRSQEWMARTGKTYQAPGHPDLPDLASDGPAFVVTGGDTTDRVATEVIEGMHDLYRVEGARMAAAHESRLIAGAQRKAFLLAHPPKPEDVTVLFWERPHPARPTMPVTTEGGGQ